MKKFLLLYCLQFYSGFAIASHQSADTCRIGKDVFMKEQILPAGLIGASLVLQTGDMKEWIQDRFPSTDTRAEDILKFVPGVQIYLFDIAGLKHKNNMFDQTKYLLISQLTTAFFVDVLKRTTQVERPNGGAHAFPSRHSSQAFSEATVLYHEFRDYHPAWAYSGYAFATATGLLRITNDMHWLPDVLAGAGIGILVTNLVYKVEPLKNWQPFKKESGISFIPDISSEKVGVRIIF